MPDIFTAPRTPVRGRTRSKPIERQSQKAVENATPAQKPAPSFSVAKNMFPLAAFASSPQGVFFATQGDGEKIVLFLRKHVITNVPWIFFTLLLLIIPPIAFPLLNTLPVIALLSANAIFILTLFYYLIIFGFALVSFINWYFNVYIVTNQRVVDVDFINILYHEVSVARLNDVQDVTTKTGGVIGAFFDFGDVFLQTPGAAENLDFIAVSHPAVVARQLQKLMEESHKAALSGYA